MRAEAVRGLGGGALVAAGAWLRWGAWAALVAAGALLFADYLAGRIGGER